MNSVIKRAVLLVLLFVPFLLQGTSFAQETIEPVEEIMIFPPGDRSPFFGQDHKYTLHLRGNGETVVTGKFVFVNESELGQDTFSLQTDNNDLTNPVAYQILKDPECIRFGAFNDCLEYVEADYSYTWGARYEEAQVTQSGSELIITLPTQVETEKTGAVFIYYRTAGLTQKVLGRFKYTFSTFQVAESIQSVAVGITTDSDVFLKGATSGVDFGVVGSAAPLAMEMDARNAQIDTMIGNIGYGQITKNASNLAANEKFVVTGEYATNKLALYGRELIIGLGIFLLVLVALLALGTKLVGNKNKKVLQTALLLAFTSSFVITALTVIVYVVFMSSNYIYIQLGVLMLFVYVFMFLLYIALFLAPIVYMGIKHGVGWALTTIFLSILILALMSAVSLFVLLGTNLKESPRIYPLDTPVMMEGSLKEDAVDVPR